MVIDAHGNRHDREGKFAGTVNDAPSGALTAPATLDERAATALDRFDLTEADLPGFAAAWTAKFGVLDEPWPEKPAEVVAGLLGRPDGTFERVEVQNGPRGEAVVTAVHPLSAEDQAHVAEFPWDEVDREVERHEFADLADADRIRDAIAGAPLRRELAELSDERDRHVSGSIPPWSVLASDDDIREADSRVKAANDTVARHPSRLRDLSVDARIQAAFAAALTVGEALPEDQAKAFSRGPGGSIEGWRVSRDAAEYGQAIANWERVSTAHAEASALPDGPLRDYLLGERPTTTVLRTRGKGRSSRYVEEPFTPTSELVRDFDLARRKYESAVKARTKRLAEVTAHQQSTAAAIASLDAAERERDAATEARWRLGWPGNPADLPSPVTTPNNEKEWF